MITSFKGPRPPTHYETVYYNNKRLADYVESKNYAAYYICYEDKTIEMVSYKDWTEKSKIEMVKYEYKLND